LEKYAGENHKNIKRISTPAIDMLMEYHWPGNERELENCIERAVLLCEEGVIHSYHLPPTLQTGKESDTVPSLSLEDAVASLEKERTDVPDILLGQYGGQFLYFSTKRILN
jgi:Nif-specific regulatory protein